MAIQFVPGQVTVSDPNAAYPNPTALSNVKGDLLKVVKLSGANFTTGNTDTLVAVLPADATITSMSLWVKTQLTGGGVTAATISIGSASGGTQYVNAVSAFAVASTFVTLSPISNIFQNYNIPNGPDLQMFVRGTATTGNPTGGEMYLSIRYVR